MPERMNVRRADVRGDILVIPDGATFLGANENGEAVYLGVCPYCGSALTSQRNGNVVTYWCAECEKIEGKYAVRV